MNGKCTCDHGEHSHDLDGCFHLDGHDRYCSCSWVPNPKVTAYKDTYLARNKCKTHPSYKAIKQPKAQCDDCWTIWLHFKRFT
jgi:hypothetical protein